MNPVNLPEDDQPLRLEPIADWLGISVKGVRRRIEKGEIKSWKMGGLRVVSRKDFKAYVDRMNPNGGSHV